jgi:hypothetical protein
MMYISFPPHGEGDIVSLERNLSDTGLPSTFSATSQNPFTAVQLVVGCVLHSLRPTT